MLRLDPPRHHRTQTKEPLLEDSAYPPADKRFKERGLMPDVMQPLGRRQASLTKLSFGKTARVDSCMEKMCPLIAL